MRNTLLSLGLDGTELQIRDVRKKVKKKRIVAKYTGAKLRELVEMLDQLGEKIHITERRGLDFRSLAEQRRDGKFPHYWIVLDGQNLFCHSADQYQQILSDNALPEDEAADGNEEGNGQPKARKRIQKRAELHEMRRIEALIDRLQKRGLDFADYFTVREHLVTGQKAPAKYVLVNESDEMELDNIAEIAPGIRQVGSKGIEIKRFKGLGEMNADELWETTMDPQRRVLLRVKSDEAEESERMFALLMGDNVELRRNFIEEHALEVKNLDV